MKTGGIPSLQTAAAEARAAELIGKRFGRLIVTGVTWIQRPKSKRIGVTCRCDCGRETAVATYSLLSRPDGGSCGCGREEIARANTKHGHASHTRPRHPLYRTWSGMHNRCKNPNNDAYHNYGGRGIKVCPEWDDFPTFATYIMSLLPPGTNSIPRGLSIDRFPDKNGDYRPGNVRIATAKQQCRNLRRNLTVEIGGVRKTLIEWCEDYRISYVKVWNRIKRGFPAIAALTLPHYAHLRPRQRDARTGQFLPVRDRVVRYHPT